MHCKYGSEADLFTITIALSDIVPFSLLSSWHDGIFFSKKEPGAVDLRDVVKPHSKHGFIFDKFRCEVCGHYGGLKTRCNFPGCVKKHSDDAVDALYFHPTCARQAGLEATEEIDKMVGKSSQRVW